MLYQQLWYLYLCQISCHYVYYSDFKMLAYGKKSVFGQDVFNMHMGSSETIRTKGYFPLKSW